MRQDNIRQLAQDYLDNRLSREELDAFLSMLKDPAHSAAFEAFMTESWHRMFDREEQVKVVPMYRKNWFRALAAAIVILAVASTWLIIQQRNQDPISNIQHPTSDIAAPAATKAMITLADGSRVTLEELNKLTQGHTTLSKTADGAVIYESGDPSSTVHGPSSIQYNTLSNPRGSSVVSITLSDGTKVWLNSESSLRYPVAFAGNDRRVEITGEAYFEVAKAVHRPSSIDHGTRMPFIVKFTAYNGNPAEVEVLGTHFNVNSYADESSAKITLIEGKVRVSAEKTMVDGQWAMDLLPNEQAQTTSNGFKKNTSVDIESTLAWKNGLFKFDKTDIQAVMRQIGRWYDVEVSYPNGIPKDKYWGSIRRNMSLVNVFRVLEESGAKFRIEGKKVIVSN